MMLFVVMGTRLLGTSTAVDNVVSFADGTASVNDTDSRVLHYYSKGGYYKKGGYYYGRRYYNRGGFYSKVSVCRF